MLTRKPEPRPGQSRILDARLVRQNGSKCPVTYTSFVIDPPPSRSGGGDRNPGNVHSRDGIIKYFARRDPPERPCAYPHVPLSDNPYHMIRDNPPHLTCIFPCRTRHTQTHLHDYPIVTAQTHTPQTRKVTAIAHASTSCNNS